MILTGIVAHIVAVVTMAIGVGLKKMGHNPERRSVSAEGKTIHWARWYDPLGQIMTLGRIKKLRKMSLEIAQLEKGQKVLDMGCGTGQLTALAHQQIGGGIVGIDAAAEMIEFAQKKFPEVNFQLAPVEKLPFEDDSFDVVMSSLVLHHLPDNLKMAAFVEAERVLKPGGRMVHIDFASGGHHNKGKNGLENLRPDIEKAGFTNMTIGQTQFKILKVLKAQKPLHM